MTWPLNSVTHAERLADHTSFRIGGPAEWFGEPSSMDELLLMFRAAAQRGFPVSIIGGGTNLLVGDHGLEGLTVHLGKGFRTVDIVSADEAPTARVRCGAAVMTQRLVSLAARHGWGDLELLAGLPGQVGGAVMMNAQQIGRFVQELTLVSLDGEVTTLTKDRIRFAYRYTALEPGILVDVTFEFPKVPVPEAAERIQQAFHYRATTQELQLPSAGCAFKNPPGASAGRLIDQAGLKGTRIGDARVSFHHANFIVNVGQATCHDVLSLMEHVQRRVRRDFGVELEAEVRMLGERVS